MHREGSKDRINFLFKISGVLGFMSKHNHYLSKGDVKHLLPLIDYDSGRAFKEKNIYGMHIQKTLLESILQNTENATEIIPGKFLKRKIYMMKKVMDEMIMTSQTYQKRS